MGRLITEPYPTQEASLQNGEASTPDNQPRYYADSINQLHLLAEVATRELSAPEFENKQEPVQGHKRSRSDSTYNEGTSCCSFSRKSSTDTD
jgi:hypothetical protein